MKVLFNLQGAEVGGGQRVAAQIASGLVSHGHHVGVLVATPGPALAWFPESRGLHLVDLTTLRHPAQIAKAIRVLGNYDLLYSHVALGGELASGLAANAAGKPHVIHQHSPLRFSTTTWVGAAQRRFFPMLLRNSLFIAVAPHIKGALVSAGIPDQRVHIVVNGVDVPVILTPRRSDGRIRIGMLSRFDPVKRIDIFLDAAALLRSTSAEFVVSGSKGATPEYSLKLREQADKVGVSLVEAGSTASSFLDSLDIVCIPSEHEGLSLVLLEALALGKAVVASDIPAMRDVTDGLRAAYLVPVGNAEALAHALRALMDDADERKRLAEVGPSLVRAQYRVDEMVECSIRVLESAL